MKTIDCAAREESFPEVMEVYSRLYTLFIVNSTVFFNTKQQASLREIFLSVHISIS
jgi:hypothetical protein